jgi:hypothetical protein
MTTIGSITPSKYSTLISTAGTKSSLYSLGYQDIRLNLQRPMQATLKSSINAINAINTMNVSPSTPAVTHRLPTLNAIQNRDLQLLINNPSYFFERRKEAMPSVGGADGHLIEDTSAKNKTGTISYSRTIPADLFTTLQRTWPNNARKGNTLLLEELHPETKQPITVQLIAPKAATPWIKWDDQSDKTRNRGVLTIALPNLPKFELDSWMGLNPEQGRGRLITRVGMSASDLGKAATFNPVRYQVTHNAVGLNIQPSLIFQDNLHKRDLTAKQQGTTRTAIEVPFYVMWGTRYRADTRIHFGNKAKGQPYFAVQSYNTAFNENGVAPVIRRSWTDLKGNERTATVGGYFEFQRYYVPHALTSNDVPGLNPTTGWNKLTNSTAWSSVAPLDVDLAYQVSYSGPEVDAVTNFRPLQNVPVLNQTPLAKWQPFSALTGRSAIPFKV